MKNERDNSMSSVSWRNWLFYVYIFCHALTGVICLIVSRSYVQRPFGHIDIVLFGNGKYIIWELKILGMGFLVSSAILYSKMYYPPLCIQVVYEILYLYQIYFRDRLSMLLIMAFNIHIFLWTFANYVHQTTHISNSIKSASPSTTKLVISVMISRLAVCVLLFIVNEISILKADLAMFLMQTTNNKTIQRSTQYYCALLGTREHPSKLANLPNEIILSSMILAGWFLYVKHPNRMTLFSTLSTTLILFNALSLFWMLQDVCNATENPHSLLLTGAIIHLLGNGLIITSILTGIIHFYNSVIVNKRKQT